MADYRLQQHLHQAAEIVVPAIGERRPRQLFLNAGRALMLWGALSVVATLVNPTCTANTTRAFVGFLAWTLGVSLLALLPVGVAGRSAPPLVLGVTMASSLFKYFFAPMELA